MYVNRISDSPLALPYTVIPHLPSPGEEFPIFVEADTHDSVRSIEGLFHTVAVVNVDIDVEDSLMVSEEFQNT
jgi:hypothetical protein